MLHAEFDEVKGQNRHYDRAWRQLQPQVRKPHEAAGRLLTGQLYALAAGAQVLRHLTPPIAEAWCQMALDVRGGNVLSEQVLSDVLLRATGGAG